MSGPTVPPVDDDGIGRERDPHPIDVEAPQPPIDDASDEEPDDDGG